jgi:hypothetical protein
MLSSILFYIVVVVIVVVVVVVAGVCSICVELGQVLRRHGKLLDAVVDGEGGDFLALTITVSKDYSDHSIIVLIRSINLNLTGGNLWQI